MSLRDLFLIFIKTGLFTVGGGLAAIPILEEKLLDTHMTNEQFLSMIAVGQSSPGSIGANMATYFGVTEFGIVGALVAVLALVIPSYITITAIARFFPSFSSYRSVKSVFATVRPAVTGLILSVAFSLTFTALFSTFSGLTISQCLIFLLIIWLHLRFKLKSISLILIGAFCGVVFL